MTAKRTFLLILVALLTLSSFSTVAHGAANSPMPHDVVFKGDEVMRVICPPEQKKGIIGEEGEIIIPLIYDGEIPFHICGEYILAIKDGVSYVLDWKNNIIFSSSDIVVTYYDGKHSILSRFTDKYTKEDYYSGKNNIFAFAMGDKNCKPITGFDYSALKPVENSDYLVASITGEMGKVLTGALDWSGREMIPMAYEIFDSVGTVNGQAMYVLTPTIIGGKTGLANLTEGKIVASCQYDGFGRQFENGRLLMCKNGKWGFIDRNGQVVVDFTYDYHWGLLEGYAKVGKNGKAGLVDINENYLLPCEYDFVSGFSDGICRYGNGDAIKELIHPAKAGGINLYYYFSTVDVSTGKDGLPQKEWVYCDPAPYIQNGRTMVPLRIVSELCGYTVQWNGEKNTITMVSPWLAIRLAVGDNEATVNILDDRQKAKAVRLDAPPVIVDGTTMVPLRFLSENANIPVIWEDATNSVILGGR